MAMRQVWNPSTQRMDQVWFDEPREEPRRSGSMRQVWSDTERRMFQVWVWDDQHQNGTLEELERSGFFQRNNY